MADLHDGHDYDDADVLEAYCMSCKQKNLVENARPVWTRKGAPATRGECSVCGTAVFRMGGTPAHAGLVPPRPVRVAGLSSSGAMAHLATFVTCEPTDAQIARRLAEDLQNGGYPVWLDGAEPEEDVAWASGVHPALDQCARMVVVLSSASAASERVAEAWRYFRSKRKLVVLAQVEPVEVPDELRRSPRFDFGQDYKTALRLLAQALMQ